MTHELDENGDVLHDDVDPFIPTGFCVICTDYEQETKPPEKH